MSEVPGAPERQNLFVDKTIEGLRGLSRIESLEGMELNVELAALFESSLDLSTHKKVESAARTVERLVEDHGVDDSETIAAKHQARMELVADAASIILAGNQSKFGKNQLADLFNKVVKIYPNSHEYRRLLGLSLAPFIVYRAEYASVYNSPDLLAEAEWFAKRTKEYELGDPRMAVVFKKVLRQSRHDMDAK